MALISLMMTETQPFSLPCQVLRNNTRWAAPRGALGGPGGEGPSTSSWQTSWTPRGPRGCSRLQKQPPRSLPGPSASWSQPRRWGCSPGPPIPRGPWSRRRVKAARAAPRGSVGAESCPPGSPLCRGKFKTRVYVNALVPMDAGAWHSQD